MPRPAPPTPGTWPRWRLLALIAAVAATALVLLAGLGWAVWSSLHPTPSLAATINRTDAGVHPDEVRDQIADRPMLPVAAAAASTPQVATRLAPTMTLPVATATGPVGVQSGFPRTPEGAVAQLAALEVAVVEAMSIPLAHQVHAAWTMPGGVPAADWRMTRNVQAFLTTLGDQGQAADDTILVAAEPAAGQVKGTDGPDWVLACVLLDVRASIAADARIGYGHCERLQWADGRWLIAPGVPPAAAPSVWPGSDLAYDAGWRPIVTAGEGER